MTSGATQQDFEPTMTTVTIEVADQQTTTQRMKAALRGEPQGAFISFPTYQALWSTLTADRWSILQALIGAGPMDRVDLARRIDRPAEALAPDLDALLNAGVLDETPGGEIEFPYDQVRVAFMLQAA
jgi:predicted transcriptional regulator